MSAPMLKISLGIALSVGLLSCGGRADVGGELTGEGTQQPSRCPQGGLGPTMVEVPAPDGSAYCIDATEVTNAMYAAWLDSLPDVPTTDCEPIDVEYPLAPTLPSLPAAPDQSEHPVVVRWCQAKAFCEANGKRLCGAVGGGKIEFVMTSDMTDEELIHLLDDLTEPSISEWYNACTANGTKLFAYGDDYEQDKCVESYSSDEYMPVHSKPQCEGGYAGIFDMVGNAGEFVNSWIFRPEDTGVFDYEPYAIVLQGPFFDGGCFGMSMNSMATERRGFRCCADVTEPPSDR